MKLCSRKSPATSPRERAILDGYYDWLLAERDRLWSRMGSAEFKDIAGRVSTMQMGREIDVPDDWIAAREAAFPKE